MTTPRKPPLAAYVLHNDSDHQRDVFATVATAMGQPWQFQRAEFVAERHHIHLRADIHRDHGVGAGVLVVDDDVGVDARTRLAALHARREGVHRFILLLDERLTGDAARADAVERDARDLLEALGVDANAVPVVRSSLTRGSGSLSDAMHTGMRGLVAALDDLPPLLAADPGFTAPAAFAREAALLDALRPLLLPATRIEQVVATTAETDALRGGAGGSFKGGHPYLDLAEAWPLCPTCRRPMGGMLQLDARDAHRAPPAHGVFVVFTCSDHRCGASEVRHHPAPSAARRRPGPPGGTVHCTDRPTILRPCDPCWLLPGEELFVAEHPDLAARLAELTGDDPYAVYHRVASAMGVGSLQVTAHFGGHHHTEVGHATPRCDVCDAAMHLVVQIDAGDDQRCVWACRDHPSSTAHEVFP
jgi:hypothetical protein